LVSQLVFLRAPWLVEVLVYPLVLLRVPLLIEVLVLLSALQ